MKKHSLGMKHISGTGKSRTLKAKQTQVAKEYARKNNVTVSLACVRLGFDLRIK